MNERDSNSSKRRQMSPTTDRLKSGQACTNCRKGKNRCDGLRPTCTYCLRRNFECDYVPATKRPRLSASYVTALEEKIRQLESRMDSGEFGGQNAGLAENDNQDNNADTGFPLSPTSVKDVLELDDSHSFEVLEFGGVSLFSAVSDLGSMPATDRPNRNISSPSRSSSIRSPSIIQPSPTGNGVVRSSRELPDDVFALPERPVEELLTELFFRHVYVFYPFVDESSFREQLSKTYEEKNSEMFRDRRRVPWLSLMNLVFAFGCDFVDLPLLKIHSLASIFAGRANDLIISVCFEIGTIQVLQSLLLLSIHLLSTMQLNKCWASVGCLLRTGQGLGLHLNPDDWNIPPLEKEMRKRLWWGIYCLDRFTSAKHGRPPAVITHPISDSYRVLTDPNPGSPSYIDSSSSGSLALFKYTVELTRITESIVVSMFKTPWLLPGKQATGTQITTSQAIGVHVEIAVEHERLLSEWKRSLPTNFQFDEISTEALQDNQKIALVVRYLHTQLLVHRQVLVALTRRPASSGETTHSAFIDIVAGACVSQCIKSACLLTSLLHSTFDSKRIGPFWYNIQFLFTSLGTLFACLTQPCLAHYVPQDNEQITKSIEMGLDIIEKVGEINEVTQQCREYYFALQQRVILKSATAVGQGQGNNSEPRVEESAMLGADLLYALQTGRTEPTTSSITGNASTSAIAEGVPENWHELYAAGDIFKDPLLPDFGFRWLEM